MKVTMKEVTPEREGLHPGFQKIGTLTLELNAYEAQVVYHLVGNVTGSSSDSPRGVCDQLYREIGRQLNGPAHSVFNVLEQKDSYFADNHAFVRGLRRELSGEHGLDDGFGGW